MEKYQIYDILSGKQFNAINRNLYGDNENYILIKLTNEKENHNGFQFKDGLNVDSIKFYPHELCRPGGIYFIFTKNARKWISYGDKTMTFYRQVIIPDDSKVYIENGKFKTDKLFLNQRQNILNLNFNFIKHNPKLLKYIKHQTEEICIEAIRKNWRVFPYIKNKTDNVCLEAVKQNGAIIEYIENKTDEICYIAIKEFGYALKYATKQTNELCLMAVKQNGYALEHVMNQTEEICLAAVKKDGCALQCVKKQTEKICLAAVRNDGYALQYVKQQTKEICLEAVKQNRDSLQYVKNPNRKNMFGLKVFKTSHFVRKTTKQNNF